MGSVVTSTREELRRDNVNGREGEGGKGRVLESLVQKF